MPFARPLRTASLCQAFALAAQALILAAWRPAELSGCLWGGGIMAGNFTWMHLLGHTWRTDGGLSLRTAALMLTKFVALLGATAAVMVWAQPSPLGFMLGLGTFLFGALGASWTLLGPTPPTCANRPRM